MFAPLIGSSFEISSLYDALARLATVIAAWASVKAERSQLSPAEYERLLILRLRHKWQYRIERVKRLLH